MENDLTAELTSARAKLAEIEARIEKGEDTEYYRLVAKGWKQHIANVERKLAAVATASTQHLPSKGQST